MYQNQLEQVVKLKSTKKNNKYQLLYIQSVPTDDGLWMRSKYIEVD
jgi:hypothetical protein